MPKSNYPEKIDTSVEIPTVRDNITEIGSDVFNSLKSAIIAIEKTLGVNPQGATGNTVATRLNKVIDPNGYILQSALTQSGVLTGPITNNEVSESAAIDENKLNLNYSTQLLQNEITILEREISSFSDQILELSAKFSAHISPEALNRHSAISINVKSESIMADDLSTQSLEEKSVQGVLSDLYNRHINYTGSNISSTNNSHSASQIFFNNENIQTITNASDVQNVIEDLSNLSGSNIVRTNLNLNSNGLIKRGKVSNDFEGNEKAKLLITENPISYSYVQGESKSTIIFTQNPTPIETISLFDIIEISGSDIESDNKEYRISKINLDSNDNLISVEIFGTLRGSSLVNLTASIYQNPYQFYSSAGLLSTVRPRQNKSNTPDIQIANPNSAYIISDSISPEFISSSAHSFNISIDGGAEVTIETYDSNLVNQNIDSIINKINEQAVDHKLNFLAYKLESTDGHRIALSHNIPNFSGDVKRRTLKITRGSSADGTEYLGFENYLNLEYEGSSQNSILLNGELSDTFGKVQTFTGANFEILTGTQGIFLPNNSFSSLNIRNGDLLVIEGSSNSEDDGVYRLTSINNQNAEVDSSYSFQGSLDENSQIIVLRCSAPIGEITFTDIGSSNGSILFDVFIDDDLDYFYSKRLEINGELRSGSFVASIIDISKRFLLSGKTAILTIDSSGKASLTVNGSVGEEVYVGFSGDYKIFSSDGLSFITLRVGGSGVPNSNISCTIHGFNEVSQDNLLLSRGVFSTSLGRVLGYPSEPGIPVLIDKRTKGTISENNISSSFVEKFIEGPRNELHASGIIRGLNIENLQIFSGYQTFDISAGVAIVNGIRIEFPGKLNHRINSNNDFYIALDPNGNILTGESVTNPDGTTFDGISELSPFYQTNVAHLALVTNQEIIDLRFFIDRNDLKAIKEIIVSNQKHMGHFTSIQKAVNYARYFSSLYPQSGTPSILIREGLYEISSPIIIDFDLNIRGSGSNTILRKTGSFALGSSLTNGEPDPMMSVFYIGSEDSNQSSRINYGCTIRELVYESSNELTGVGAFITLAEGVSNSKASFSVRNIQVEGPTGISNSGEVGEYFIVVGYVSPSTIVPTAGTYGNLFISNCFLRRAGLELGPCKLRDAADMIYQNILATSNIGTFLSPNENNSSFEIFEESSIATLQGVLEVGNIIN